MISTDLLFDGYSPSACSIDPSTDPDADFIDRQRHARRQLSHSDTEDKNWEHCSNPLPDKDQDQAVSESNIWQMPPSERTASESVLSEMHGEPTLPYEEPQADDFVPRIPLLSHLIKTEKDVSADNSSLPTSSDGTLRPAPITPLVPPVLIPKIYHPTSVMGTIIHCPGTLSNPKVFAFHPLPVSSLEAIFHIEDHEPQIPALVGLPLWMRHHHNDKNESTINQAENELVRQLWINANFDDPDSFGTSPSQTGSKLVMRKDGINLIPQHLEALCHFCLYVLQVTYGDTGRLSSHPRKCERQKRMFKRMATRRGFEEFWEEYREERALRDARWMKLPSPYDSGKLGMRYERLVPAGNGDMGVDRLIGTVERVEETMRTLGSVTRGLARKREVMSENDGRWRKIKWEASEASSEASDVVPPSEQRTGYLGKSVTRESFSSNIEN